MKEFLENVWFYSQRRNGGVIIYFSITVLITSWTGTLMKRFLASSDAVMHLLNGGDFRICMK